MAVVADGEVRLRFDAALVPPVDPQIDKPRYGWKQKSSKFAGTANPGDIGKV
eukprot:gene377-28057_t